MRDSIQNKLAAAKAELEKISVKLMEPDVAKDQKKYLELNKDFARLKPVVEAFDNWQQLKSEYQGALEMRNDPELAEMAEEEISRLQEAIANSEHEIQLLLLPKDPNDERSAYLEIRAGTGGHEAAIFVGDLYRMYTRHAEEMRWQLETISLSEGEQGGYKEIIILVKGDHVYGTLKFESGTHRVQRVPATESQGRIHTSACTVAVLPEVETVDDVEIDPSDLRIDTYRSSGAGGQHVNTTDSAVRITHIPTGVVVECQDERSQHKNKARAMKLLHSKILQASIEAQQKEISSERRNLVGSGDRSERIRTYNFPQGRITDHRIQLTLYRLSEVLDGYLALLSEPLKDAHNADLMLAHKED